METDARLPHDRHGRGDPGLGAPHVCGRLQHGRSREIELGAGQLFVAGERLRLLQLGAGIVERGLTVGAFCPRLREAGLGFVNAGLNRGRIEPRQHLTRLDARVEIDVD